MHNLTYDLGRPQGTKKYYPGRDSSNVIVRCSCGWAYSNTMAAVQERGKTHQKTFRREIRNWNAPDRATLMPRTEF